MKEQNNVHSGHRQRLKNRFIENGIDQFDDHNIIELLLFFGIPYKDTNEIAHELINRFGSVSGVIDARFDELVQVKGVSDHVATLICLIRELSVLYAREQLEVKQSFETREDIGKYLIKQYLLAKTEKFSILALDSKKSLKGFTFLSEGTANATEVSIPHALELVLNKKWSNIVLCHNHPSGSLMPSNQDVATTIAFQQAMKIAGVNLIDHVIVNHYDYLSMASSPAFRKYFSGGELK